MIEKTVREFLARNLDCPVVMERSDGEPPLVLIEKTSGGRENRICSATFALQSYGNTLLEAAELNEKVKAVADELVEINSILSIRQNSDYVFNDTRMKGYRYQAVIELTYNEEIGG